MKKFILILCVLSCIFVSAANKSYDIPEWPGGENGTALMLNGVWDFKFSSERKWDKISVPGEAAMQGYAIEHDSPFLYRKSFVIPASWKGKRMILRFDGVYSHAVLSVNGHFVREHAGGFTRWETDITQYVETGAENEILVEVTDRIDDISYASGYAHHPVGGILRDVTLFAIPQTYIYDLHTETCLAPDCRDAVLKVTYSADAVRNSKIRYTLVSPSGEEIRIKDNATDIRKGENTYTAEIPVSSPLKWDAEHPRLYTLVISLWQGKKEIIRITRKIGFRKIEIAGNRMLVNGIPVKLRGACRHDIHPVLGRTTSPELDSLDAVLFKEANLNFVRTSHYPPSERFLKQCDRLGIYVECEMAACFVDTHRQINYKPGNSQDDPDFTGQYLSQCQEMVKPFRSHASVIIWSIGNESRYGENFRKCYDWIKQTDKTRPVIFSWPGTVSGDRIYDILSIHYPDWQGNIRQHKFSVRNFQCDSIPVLFDEWAHPACYTYATLREDPNIREFWGMSMDRMWSNLFESSGGLGGAVWGFVDETFMLPKPKAGSAYWKTFARTNKPEDFSGDCVGYGEWGIVDVWRRKKPEFWSTKKACSPVRVLSTEIPEIAPGAALELPVYNRFDHTDLNEIRIRYTYGGIKKEVQVGLAPHEKGSIMIPGQNWKSGDKVFLEFLTADGKLIDAEMISIGKPVVYAPEPKHNTGTLTLTETENSIVISGKDFSIPVCRKTGLIRNAVSHGRTVIESGPYLHIDMEKSSAVDTGWIMDTVYVCLKDSYAEVNLERHYADIVLNVRMRIDPSGKTDICYTASGTPDGIVRESGLRFILPDSFKYLTWDRDGYWSWYPEGSFSGTKDTVPLYNSHFVKYGEYPDQPWRMDTHNYYYWGDTGANCSRPLTRTAKGTKENIRSYTLHPDISHNGSCLSVTSVDASIACRISKPQDGRIVLYVMNKWDYPEIAWGNYCRKVPANPCGGKISFSL